MAKLWPTFDTWALTDCTSKDGVLQFGGPGTDFEDASTFTNQRGTWLVVDSWGTRSGATSDSQASIRDTSLNSGTVRCRTTYPGAAIGDYVGIYVCGSDVNDRDGYVLFPYSGTLRIWRNDNGALTSIASVADAYLTGANAELRLTFGSGSLTGGDVTAGITVGPVADATYPGGAYGTFLDNSSGGRMSTGYAWCHHDTTALSFTAASTPSSTTFDAGSAVTRNGIVGDLSLNGGTVTFDVSGVAGGDPNWIETGLTLTNGAAAFTASRTFRYWHVRINGARTTTAQQAGVMRGSVRLANGAAGGGSTTTLSSHSAAPTPASGGIRRRTFVPVSTGLWRKLRGTLG